MTGLLVLFVLLSFQACEDELITTIPNAPVEITVYLDVDLQVPLATRSFLKPEGTARRIGFGGVLLVNGYNSSSGEPGTFYAYDLACPHEIDRNITVIPDKEGRAKCPECGSVYFTMMGTGFPDANSISKYPLKSYIVNQSVGGNKISIHN